MRRRTLLATVGAGLTAGCSGSVPLLDPKETPTDADSSPEGDESTPESAPTETDEPTATGTEFTEESTETETPTQAERRGAEVVGNAHDLLGDAYDAYAGFSGPDTNSNEPGTATLLNVTIAADVTVSDVTGPANEARSTLDELPRRASGEQYDTSRRLRGVATVLSQGIRCQDDLRDAYEEFEFVFGLIYADSTGRVPDALGRIRTTRSDAAGHLETIESETPVEAVDAFDRIDASSYEAKVDQFRRAISAFETLPDTVAGLKRGLDAFRSASRDYRNERYLAAERGFETGEKRLRPASDTLSDLDVPEPMTDAVTDLTGVTNALALAAVDLEAAAGAGSRGERQNRETAFADAKEHLRASDVAVERLRVVQRLLDA